MKRFCVRVFPLVLLVLLPALVEPADRAAAAPPRVQGLRVVVLDTHIPDLSDWMTIARLGANLVATAGPPSAEADRVATAAGLSYLAFLTTDQIDALTRDPARILEARGEQSLAGFYYEDAAVAEGFTAPAVQQRAYFALKDFFPDKLVLFPTRLDPIAWEPDFLERYFRPEFTDLVTPYFYPVGTTVLGAAQEDDAWRQRLSGLLSALAARVTVGKGLLPVLQGFEQENYPVGAGFLSEQMAVYRSFWPDLANAAVFSWRIGPSESGVLIPLAERPQLQQGVCSLFAELAFRPARCGRTVAFR